jgi:DNA-binding NarL/FixJ family response regulator
MFLKILFVDRHPLLQAGLASALRKVLPQAELLVAHGARAGSDVLPVDAGLDLVIFDPVTADGCDLSLVRLIRSNDPSVGVILFSGDALRACPLAETGAAAFVAKTAPTQVLMETILEVLHSTGRWRSPLQRGAPASGPGSTVETGQKSDSRRSFLTLTARQLQVLTRVCLGKTNRQTALDLGLTEKTVKSHVTALLKVLGVTNRTQAKLAAHRLGLVAE